MQHYLDDKAGTTAGNETAKQNLEYFADTMGSATEDFLGFNYSNLTDTTFGGDINHTASTNALGSGVLLDTNTQQFNQAKEQGELENRMPPNSLGVDWSNMDVGAIQVQADTNQAVAYVDSVMKDNATSKEAVADYAGITTGIGSCLTLAGCGAGLTNAAIAFSDLGEVLSQDL
ncbi:hypothetical protein [Vibrio aphrogenes]|uniref:hypothetical protein n=1 Tax=Vibrio aphrogenes TaxID=1891186 RepID=UPI000B35DF51|nr:hypothetical protein [Vibrio aphrogenes]